MLFLNHLIGAAVFIRFSSNDEEFSSTAGDCQGADGFFHRGHLSPAVGEGVIHLHVTETTLPIITSNCIHLQDTHTDMKNKTSNNIYSVFVFNYLFVI